jgi:hypothetical protein
MDEQRERLLLAYAVATYDTSLRSMEALREAGVAVGYGTTGAIRRSLIQFAARWDAMHGHHLWREERLPLIVAEAREHCTTNQSEIDELTNRE